MLVILTVLFFSTVYTIWGGLVLSILWGWFIVPLGLPEIGLANAIGVSLVVGFLTRHHATSEKDLSDRIIESLITPLIVLGFGWVVHLFL